jgi:hypothetical protein
MLCGIQSCVRFASFNNMCGVLGGVLTETLKSKSKNQKAIMEA